MLKTAVNGVIFRLRFIRSFDVGNSTAPFPQVPSSCQHRERQAVKKTTRRVY
jgi:hypothetical protein